MSEERLQEIKDSIEFQYTLAKAKGYDNALLFTNEEEELVEEIERLNNIINQLEKELKDDYKIWMCNSRSNGKSVKFGIDVCKMYFYNRLQELKGSDSNVKD